MPNEEAKAKIGAVLVIGAGIAGMQASLDLANSGYYVYLVDQSPTVGGLMSQLDKTFPTKSCSPGTFLRRISSPNFGPICFNGLQQRNPH